LDEAIGSRPAPHQHPRRRRRSARHSSRWAGGPGLAACRALPGGRAPEM